MGMNADKVVRQEKMLKLWEELVAAEEDRLAGRVGVTPDELESSLDRVIDEAEHGQDS